MEKIVCRSQIVGNKKAEEGRKTMYEKVRDYIEENKMIESGCTVLAGVSGGGDSMAMLSFLKDYQKEKEFTLLAVHIHHGIRGEEADRDEALVKHTCENWGIPYRIYHYQVPELARKLKTGLEEAGRLARKEAFALEKKRLALPESRMRIALAHNQNDLAETVIHNLCRGSGLRGLAAMSPAEGYMIRPVLCLEKREIGDYLEKEQIPYILDSSNLSDDYTRNRIRHHVLPAMEEMINPRTTAHLAETARVLSQAAAYLEKQGEALLWQNGTMMPGENSFFLENAFFEGDAIVVSCGLIKVFELLAGKRKDFTSVHVSDVMKLAEKQVGKKIMLPYGLNARRDYNGVILSKAMEQSMIDGEWELPVPGSLSCPLGRFEAKIISFRNQKIEEKKCTKWLDYDKIKYSLSIRTRRTGDFLIIDRNGSRKKLNRCLIDEKVPAEKRDGIPLVAAGNEILWIVGGRINEKYKITPETRRILELQYKGGMDLS